MSDRITDTIAEALEPYLFNEDQGYVSPTVRRQWSYSVTDIVLAALRANNIEPIQLPEIDALEHFQLTGDGVRQYDPNGFGAYRFFSFAEMRELAGSFLVLLAAAAAAEEGRS